MAKTGFYQTNPVVEEVVGSLVETSTDVGSNDDNAKTSFYPNNTTYESAVTLVDALADAEAAAAEAAASAAAALASQVAAATSAADAQTAETNAETAETNAETAETNAETAEYNAGLQADAAAASAVAAAASATAANSSAVFAAGSETAAEAAAAAAATSQSAAGDSATAAAASAAAAATSANNADSSEADAEAALAATQAIYDLIADLPSTTFLGMLDTPDSYAGAGGDAVIVKMTEDGLEFGTASSVAALDDLTDVTITAAASGDYLRYNGSAWVDVPVSTLVTDLDPSFLTPAEGNAAYQPLDGDLTAIAALTTTAYGRGLLTLADEDALEATLDTLPNLTSIQSLTVTLADAGADAILGWDDSAAAYENLTQGEVRAVAGLATTDSPEFTAVNIGHASDTTITRVSAGVIAVEGTTILTTATGQPLDADLTSWAGVTRAAGFDTFVATPSTANFLSLITDETFVMDSDIGSTVQAFDADLTTLSTAFTTASASGAASLAFHEDTDNGTNRVLLQGPASTADVTVTLPSTAGTLLTAEVAASTYQPLDADLTSWAAITRASGFDTFATTPSLANLGSLLTDEASGLITFMTTPSSANLASLVTDDAFSLSDAELGAIAGLTSAADKVPYFTGSGTAAVADFTAYGRTLVALADETALEALLDTLPNLTSIQGLTVTLADAGANAFFGWDDVAGAYENLTAAEAEAIIEPLIDTLANLTSVQGLTITLADAGADAIFGWDDSANAYQNLSAADVRTAISVYSTAQVDAGFQPLDADLTAIAAVATTAAGRSALTVVDNNLDQLLFWDDSAGSVKTMVLADTATEASPAAGDYLVLYGAEGDVRKVDWSSLPGVGSGAGISGTPANNQIAVWTGATDIEGDSDLTYDTTTNTLAVVASGKFAFGAVNILDDSAGTTTLSNIDAIDATTEATIEAAIDTLANLTSIQSLTVTLADAGANAFFGWDDTAGAYENLTAAEAEAIIEPLIDTLANLTSIQGVSFTFGSYAATILNNTTEAGFKQAVNLEIGVDVQAFDADLTSLATNWVQASAAGASSLDFHEDTDNGTNRVRLQGPASTADITVTLPSSAGTLLTAETAASTYQPLDSDLTSWAGVTRAAGFDTFVATPSSANLASLLTDEAFSMSDAELGALAGLTSAADKVPYFTGSGTAALADLSSAMRTFMTTPSSANFASLVSDDAFSLADAELGAIAGLVSAADRLPYFTGAGTASLATFTATGRSIVDDASVTAVGQTLFGADPAADRIIFFDDSADSFTYLSMGNSVAITTTTLDTIQDIRTTANPQFATIEVGAATDTTLARNAAGVLQVEGVKLIRGDTGATDNRLLRADSTGGSLLQSSGVLVSDNSDITAYDAVNDGNPEFRLGADDAEELHIQTVYDAVAQTLNYVLFTTDVASVTADKGLYRFNVDGTDILDIDDGGINFTASKGISIAGTDIITDAAGTATLSNIDALDNTTETTIETAIDTLANLTSIQGRTVTLADAGADAVLGWDDSANAYQNLSAADVRTAISVYSTAQVDAGFQPLDADLTSIAAVATTAAGRSALTVVDNNLDQVLFWDDSAGSVKTMVLADMTAEASPAAGDFLVLYGAEGDVRKVDWSTLPGAGSGAAISGTPVNNQLAVWTNATTIEGDSDLTYDTTTNTLAVVASGKFAFGAVNILDDSAGTTTLSNIDVLDATTESTIEAAIDTLANLTSIQGRTVTLADAGTNAFFGWDDTAGAYENLTDAEVEAIIEPLIDTLANLTSIQGVSFTFGSYAATLLNNASEAAFKAAVNLEIGVDVQAYDADLTTLASAFSTASAAGAAYLDFAEDTDNGTNRVRLQGAASTADVTVTLPAATTTLVGTDTSDVLTNKSIDLTNNTLVGSVAEFNTALESADFYTTGGTDVSLADGGTGASLTDPNLDTLPFWDDSAGTIKWAALADMNTEAAPAAGDYLFLIDSGGNLLKVNWSSLPGAGGGISNVVEDTTPQLGGDLDLNGKLLFDATLGGLLAYFGSSSEFQFYTTSAGATGVRLSGWHDSPSPADGDIPFAIFANAGVDDEVVGQIRMELDDGATGTEDTQWQFVTRAAGADLTALTLGDTSLSFDSSYHHTFNVGSTALGTVVVTGTDATGAGVGIDLYSNSASPADNDGLASINVWGKDDGAANQAYGYIAWGATDVSAGTEDSSIILGIQSAGSALTALTLGTTTGADGVYGHVFNTGSSQNGALEILSTNTGTGGPLVATYFNSTSPADGDNIGYWEHAGKDDGGGIEFYSVIQTVADDVSAGTEDSELYLIIRNAGADLTALTLGGTDVRGATGVTVFDAGTAQFSGVEVMASNTDVGGPTFLTYHNSASPAADDYVGGWEIWGEDSASNAQAYAKIYGRIVDTTSTSEDGRLEFYTTSAGADLTALTLNGSGQYMHVFDMGGVVEWPNLRITNSDPGIGAPFFSTFHNSESPADGDYVGGLALQGNNDEGLMQYASIEAFSEDVSAGTEDGSLAFMITSGGSSITALELNGSTTTSTFATDVFVGDNLGVLIGHTAQVAFVDNGGNASTPEFQVLGTGISDAAIGIARYDTTDANSPYLMFAKSGNATVGSHTVVASGEALGRIVFAGSDGTDFEPGAAIEAYCDGTPGAGDMPGRLVFSTTSDAAEATTERLRITSTGRMVHTLGQVAHFWVYWTANSTTILASHNVSSIDDDAVGDAGINLTTAFSSNNFTAHVTTNDTTNSWDNEECQSSGINVHTSATVDVLCSTITDGTTAACSLTDPDQWQCTGFGVSA